MMAAEIIQLEGKVVQETGELNLNEQVQGAELSVQIAFIEIRIKKLKFHFLLVALEKIFIILR